MTRDGKTPDGKKFEVRRPWLPAGMGSKMADEAVDADGSSSSSGGLGALLFRAIFFITLGLLLVPISLFFRLLFRRWTVDAQFAGETRRWRARSRSDAGKGVEAVAGALERGDPLDAIAGLTPL